MRDAFVPFLRTPLCCGRLQISWLKSAVLPEAGNEQLGGACESLHWRQQESIDCKHGNVSNSVRLPNETLWELCLLLHLQSQGFWHPGLVRGQCLSQLPFCKMRSQTDCLRSLEVGSPLTARRSRITALAALASPAEQVSGLFALYVLFRFSAQWALLASAVKVTAGDILRSQSLEDETAQRVRHAC